MRKYLKTIFVLGLITLVSLIITLSFSRKRKKEDIVKIVMWQHASGEDEMNFFRKRKDEFNETYKDKIELEFKIIEGGSQNEYETKIMRAAASGSLPDILDLDGPYVANYAYLDVLIPLNDFINENEDWYKDYINATIQQGTWNDKLYALGVMESSVGVYYNKDIMNQYNIMIPDTIENNWTWDEFQSVLEKLGKELPEEITPLISLGGSASEWLIYMGAPFIWSNEGKLISDDGFTAEGYINSEQNIETMTKIQELFINGYVPTDVTENLFQEGRAAMAISGPWTAASIRNNYKEMEGKYGIAPYPIFKTQHSPTGSWCWGLTVQSKHPKEAFEVIKWFTNQDSGVGIFGAIGMLPSTKSAYSKLKDFDSKPLSIFKDQNILTGQARPRTPLYPILTKEFARAYFDIINGKDVKTALDEAAKKIDNFSKRRFTK